MVTLTPRRAVHRGRKDIGPMPSMKPCSKPRMRVFLKMFTYEGTYEGTEDVCMCKPHSADNNSAAAHKLASTVEMLH